MTYKEKQIYHLYEYFQKATYKLNQPNKWLPNINSKSFSEEKLFNHKYWKYFEKCYKMFEQDSGFNLFIFYETIINYYKKIYPAQLTTKKFKEQYYTYKMKFVKNKINSIKQIYREIANTFKFLKDKIEVVDHNNIKSLFDYNDNNNLLPKGILYIIQGLISPFFFTVSKSFINIYKQLDPDIKQEIKNTYNINQYYSYVMSNPKIYNFLKKVFGDEIV